MLNTYAHFESMQMGLETFFHDADKGKEKFEELRKLSNETTFGVDELTNSFTQLANVGVNVDKIESQLVMLGNLANGDKTKFAELVNVYSKIQSTGKAGSMQLQQIAMKGVPIYDMLKKMGVQGTATAKDIQKAFENMTSEIDETTGQAGQFYGAMENINKTIEGKEGFISDYFKEFSVNLMEVTGIADTYKSILDSLKEAIGTVSDKLLEWNENPIAKAILSGALTAILGGLVVIIGVSLVSALNTIIVKLGIIATLKTLISGPAGLIALGVAGFASLAVGLNTYTKAQDEAIEKQKKLNAEMNKTTANIEQSKGQQSREERLKSYQNSLEKYKETLEAQNKELAQIKKDRDDYNKMLETKNRNGIDFDTYLFGYDEGSAYSKSEWMKKQADDLLQLGDISKYTYDQITSFVKRYGNVIDNYGSDIGDQLDKEIDRVKGNIDQTNSSIKETETNIESLQSVMNGFKGLEAMRDTFDSLYENVGSKTEKELKAVNDDLALMTSYLNLIGQVGNDGKIIQGDKEQVKQVIEYLETQKAELNVKLKIENAKDYEKSLMDALGFNEELASKFIGQGTSADWIEEYISGVEKQIDRQRRTDKRTGLNAEKQEFDYIAEEAQNLVKVYEKLMTMQGEFGEQADGTLDNATQKLIDLLDSLRADFLKAGGDLDEWNEKIRGMTKDQNTDLIEQIDIWEQLTNKMTDYFEKMGMSQGTAEMFAETLTSIVQTQIPNSMLSTFEAIGDAWAKSENAGKAMQKQFASFVQQIMSSLSLTCIQAGVNLIAQSGWAGVPAALGLFALGGATGIASGFIGSLSDNTSSSRNKSALDDLTQSYKDLKKAIKEQEEYYLKKKHELNMYALNEKVTKVNDMILSPNGTFSTSPQDTIIATKNPQSLGSVTNNIKVINNAGVDVNVRENKGNGMNEILVTISKKIASDVAEGLNGWDGAFALQRQRVDGRRI